VSEKQWIKKMVLMKKNVTFISNKSHSIETISSSNSLDSTLNTIFYKIPISWLRHSLWDNQREFSRKHHVYNSSKKSKDCFNFAFYEETISKSWRLFSFPVI